MHSLIQVKIYTTGMAGKTSWDEALVDQYVDLSEELHKETYKEFYAVSEEDKVCVAPQGFVGPNFWGSDPAYFHI